MSNTHEVISDLLDNRTVDLADLAAALEAPDGRALLIDLLALRHAVQPTDAIPAAVFNPAPRRVWFRSGLAAAAVLAAVMSGYVVGARRAPSVVVAAPQATRVVDVTSNRQDLFDGGRR
jgi:hypothetical protein